MAIVVSYWMFLTNAIGFLVTQLFTCAVSAEHIGWFEPKFKNFLIQDICDSSYFSF